MFEVQFSNGLDQRKYLWFYFLRTSFTRIPKEKSFLRHHMWTTIRWRITLTLSKIINSHVLVKILPESPGPERYELSSGKPVPRWSLPWRSSQSKGCRSWHGTIAGPAWSKRPGFLSPPNKNILVNKWIRIQNSLLLIHTIQVTSRNESVIARVQGDYETKFYMLTK